MADPTPVDVVSDTLDPERDRMADALEADRGDEVVGLPDAEEVLLLKAEASPARPTADGSAGIRP